MNQHRKDLHAVLGVDEKAGPEELRRAYLALAVKYHPDRNPGDAEAEERFKDISQAYAVLSDPAARARYERLRPQAASRPGPSAAGPKAGPARGPRPASGGAKAESGPTRPGASAKADSAGPGTGEPDFDEILAGFFKSAKGRDTLRDLEEEMRKAGLKFKMEDVTGWFKSRRRAAQTSSPQGSFLARLASWLPGAASRARKKAEAHEIHYHLSLSPQAAAGGTTVEIAYLRDDQLHHLKVKIPAGAKDGARLRLPGQGRLKPGPDGARGDLILTILVGSKSVADLWR